MSAEPRTPAEARARDAVRALPPPAADAAFRARLKADFVAGSIAPPVRAATIVPLRSAFTWRRAFVPLAAAAAAVLVIAGVLNRGAPWHLMAVAGDGVAVVDGVPVPLGHADELARRLVPGARVRVPETATVELASMGTLAIQLTPGTDLTVPAVPGRWWARRVAAEIRSGEIRVTSGRRFKGARLAIETPAASVELSGTTLAVICDPEGTCVCVLEGHARVGPRGGAMMSVPGGMRRFVFLDARAPELATMREIEHVKLGEMRAQYADAMTK